MKNRIIAVDDEQTFLESLKRGLITSGYRNIHLENDSQKAAELFENGEYFDLAIIDITMPKMNGLDLLSLIKTHSPETECIMITAIDETKIAVKAIRNGAYDYLVKPIEKKELLISINRALERKRLYNIMDISKRERVPNLIQKEAFKEIITVSENMIRILKEAELHAAGNAPILITGESGTGKELLARAVHMASPRAKAAFIPVNMASLTGSLFDAAFFGHTKGAFTGAEQKRAGYLEHSNKGTLFLDEIGSLPFELQGKLLRVIQEGEYLKLGEDNPKKIDVRFIAATNENLEQQVRKKQFRKDLYYRLKGGWLHLPPLKNRIEDIPLLVKCFLKMFLKSDDMVSVKKEVLEDIISYDFPGNVRELKAIIQSAVILSEGKRIMSSHFPKYMRQGRVKQKNTVSSENDPILALSQVEKNHILSIYQKTGKNKSQSAKLLGIGLNTLRRKLEFYEE